MAFTDYAFYKAHGGKLAEAVYTASADEAAAEIISQTNGTAATYDSAMQEAVKLCECALVDSIAAFQKAAAMLPKGISSVNNDGYSISVGSTTPQQAEAQERAAICARFLQAPVNLMCRWL